MLGKEIKDKREHVSSMSHFVRDLIPGIAEGLQMMNVGSKYRFYVPAKLGYGESRTPGAGYIFEIELLDIVK